jgi:hypothetical protein
MTSIGNNPSLAKNRMVIFIEGPLMMGAGWRWRLRDAFAHNLIVPTKV